MRTRFRRSSLVPVALGACLLVSCGMDPPPPPGEASNQGSAPTAAPVAAGIAPVPRDDLTQIKSNGAAARCNIETLAGKPLEAVHPAIAAAPSVALTGWYAVPQAAEPSQPEAGAAAQAPAAGASEATSPGPMLVIASENGIKHWTVALPPLRERRDVAKAFNDPSLARSGFAIELDLSGLRPGFYGLHLSDGGHTADSVCGLGRGFVIQ